VGNEAFREFRRLVYALKRRFGRAVFLNATTNDDVDYASGKITSTPTTVKVRRAAILTAKAMRYFTPTAPMGHLGRQFEYGGLYDDSMRFVILSSRDVPSTFPLDLTATITIESEVYSIQGISSWFEWKGIMAARLASQNLQKTMEGSDSVALDETGEAVP